MVKEPYRPELSHPPFAGRIGVARANITPSVGIPARNWGAATHELAESIHRDLYLDVVTFESHRVRQPLVLIEADLGFWQDRCLIQRLRDRILARFELDSSRLIFGLAHTHAAPTLSSADLNSPGRSLTQAYLKSIEANAVQATRNALNGAQDATLDWNTGCCKLAASRDLADPTSQSSRFVCGYNPGGPADDTLLVGRVTTRGGQLLATLINYACHPTTLAWENRSISPDFVGAMRETVEKAVGGMAVFIQGASGELAPRYQYVDDPQVADCHGRQLGYVALATLEDMEPQGTRLVFDRIVESGAPLAVWRHRPMTASTALAAIETSVVLPLKNWPSGEELERQRAAATDTCTRERLKRERDTRKAIGDGETFSLPLWVWRVGEAVFVAVASEAYSQLQQQIRGQFPDLTVVCTSLVNDSVNAYLPPAELYDKDIYQVWRTPFGRGSLELTIQALLQSVRQITTCNEEKVLYEGTPSKY